MRRHLFTKLDVIDYQSLHRKIWGTGCLYCILARDIANSRLALMSRNVWYRLFTKSDITLEARARGGQNDLRLTPLVDSRSGQVLDRVLGQLVWQVGLGHETYMRPFVRL